MHTRISFLCRCVPSLLFGCRFAPLVTYFFPSFFLVSFVKKIFFFKFYFLYVFSINKKISFFLWFYLLFLSAFVCRCSRVNVRLWMSVYLWMLYMFTYKLLRIKKNYTHNWNYIVESTQREPIQASKVEPISNSNVSKRTTEQPTNIIHNNKNWNIYRESRVREGVR